MAERENWLQETTDASGATTFTVQQRHRDHLTAIRKAWLWLLAAGILCIVLIKQGGGAIILGGLLATILFPVLLAVATFSIIVTLGSLGMKSRVSFVLAPVELQLLEKAQSNYPSVIERSHISALYVDGPRGSSQVATSRIIVGSPGFVALHGAANAATELSAGLGRTLGGSVGKSRYTVTINADAQKIHLAGALSQPEAEYLMHRIERAWAV